MGSRSAAAVLEALPLAAAALKLRKQRDALSAAPSRLEWAEQQATIVLPTEGRQRFQPYRYQVALLKDFSSRRLILKARQTGISNVVAIEALQDAAPNARQRSAGIRCRCDRARGF